MFRERLNEVPLKGVVIKRIAEKLGKVPTTIRAWLKH